MNLLKQLILLGILFMSQISFMMAQVVTDHPMGLVREGNNLYQKGDFVNSESAYRASLNLDGNEAKTHFNLGDALYQQGRWEEAISAFQEAISKDQSGTLQAQAHHNIGNAYMESQQYDKAIGAYKQSLMQNPSDPDTRYNLSYALQKLKQQQQQQQNQDKKDKEKEEQESEGEQNQDQEQQDQNQPQQSPPSSSDSKQATKMSPQEIQQLLDAVKRQEAKTQQKVLQKQKPKPAQKKKIQKDW